MKYDILCYSCNVDNTFNNSLYENVVLYSNNTHYIAINNIKEAYCNKFDVYVCIMHSCYAEWKNTKKIVYMLSLDIIKKQIR